MARKDRASVTDPINPSAPPIRVDVRSTSDGWYATCGGSDVMGNDLHRSEYANAQGHGETRADAIADYLRTLRRLLNGR